MDEAFTTLRRNAEEWIATMTYGQSRTAFMMLASSSAMVLAGCQSVPLGALLTTDYERTLDAYSQVDTTVTDITSSQAGDGREVYVVSAFFGLDDALPRISNRFVCKGAGGADGMPVIFSHEVDHKTLEPGDFRVVTASGMVGEITCLTLAPADDRGELRTVLLAGDYGSLEDQPSTIEIVGNLLTLDGSANFKGLTIDVTPLEDGPTLVWAETTPQEQWKLGVKATPLPFGGGSGCPAQTQQIVRATWNGGITKPGGDPADDEERQLYQVTVRGADNTLRPITPLALADLNDGDNNHLLCLDTTDPVEAVSFPAGHVTDPREDLNPDTFIALSGL